jgi:RNA polymerase sigma-70 factor (sigma-E family)
VGSDAGLVMGEAGSPDVIGFDDASFEEFVAGSSARLFTMATLLTGGHRAEAEDLLQGAFERAYRRWGRISRRADPEPYVRQILVNASVDRWRRLRRHPEAPLAVTAVDPGTADTAAAIADRDLLLRGLAALPPRQRAVLVLRYFEDLSEAQTATVLGCTVGTVKSQTARGLARLRDGVGAAGDRDPGTRKGTVRHD